MGDVMVNITKGGNVRKTVSTRLRVLVNGKRGVFVAELSRVGI